MYNSAIIIKLMNNSFRKFTNMYSLQKTLRFELKPVGKTSEMLSEDKVIQIDEDRMKSYEKIKPFIDRLHRDFINEALESLELSNLENLMDYYLNYKKDRSNKGAKDKYNKVLQDTRNEVVKAFNKTGFEWSKNKFPNLNIKKSDLNILFEEEIFQVMKSLYGSELESKLVNKATGELVSIFDSWKGFKGYFDKFFKTRENFYKSDGTSSSIATRIVDQNLIRYIENLLIYRALDKKINFTEVEENFGINVSEIFTIENYNKCLLQAGIDNYNNIIGGVTLKNGEKKKGINELVNKYRQDNKGEKLPFLRKLDKQIHSEKEKFIDEIENIDQLEEVLKEFLMSTGEKINKVKNLVNNLLDNPDQFDLSGIFMTKESLNSVQNKWMDDSSMFIDSLFEVLKSENFVSNSSKRIDGTYRFPDFISLRHIQEALNIPNTNMKIWKDRYYKEEIVKETDGSIFEQFLFIFRHEYSSLFERHVFDEENKLIEQGYAIYEKNFEELLKDFKFDKTGKWIIKNFLDEVLRIYQMSKYFAIEKKRAWVTEYDELLDDFYTNPENGYLLFYTDAYETIVQPYNKIRNFVTKKPYSTEKWKLNFDNPTLANGWDKNKEGDNTTVILRKEKDYFVGIMKKGHNRIFSEEAIKNNEIHRAGTYEKMNYKLFPDPSKMMPKVCFSVKGLDFFKPSKEIVDIYKDGSFKKGEKFSLISMQKLINFYITCLSSYPGWKSYEFVNVKSAEEYKDNIGEFYADVASSGYKLWFEKISDKYISEKNENKELYLFKIHNQDFAKGKTGKKNLHTLYFEQLFSAENAHNNFSFKLNGQAEIFFRPKSIEAESENRNFKRPIINKKRYTEDKIFFHVPTTLNRIPRKIGNFNSEINNYLANNPDVNIIGVDRGEKHLIYFSVLNQKGEIIQSGSFNKVNNTNYAEKLGLAAKQREISRRNWQDVEKIKDLKQGYISNVVRELADLAIKHNAIIVMEDLNMRFKQIRGGIEKSVYQQLEKALIDKLSFLVNKDEENPGNAGHMLNAYQLTSPIVAFKDMGKQTGIIFYTQASYTSKVDPLSGWRPNLYLKYTNAEDAKKLILQFSSINYRDERFEFTYDLKNFIKSYEFPQKTNWTVCSCVERFRWNRSLNKNKGGYEHYDDMTEAFRKLFETQGVNYENDILGQIEVIDTTGNEKFFKDFIYYFGLICQIRNTQEEKHGDENDFIQSPVKPFFDSRFREKFGKYLPTNGDDNGAYNIARKGILLLHKISKYKNENEDISKIKFNDLYISHNEWDNFITKI